MPKFYHKEKVLKFVSLGGVGTVNKNLHVYEYGDDILVVDCGIDFPESEERGVDVVLPDIGYLRDKIHKIKGIVITHGHYDHYAALPYLLKDLGSPPVYSTKLVQGFIKVQLTEFNLLKGQSLHIIDPNVSYFELGCFRITPFRVGHSVPDAIGFFIQTPVGNFVHAADFKCDWTPVEKEHFDAQKLASLSKDNPVLCFMSDCLGALNDGYTSSEREIEFIFEDIISRAHGQVLVSTISSNISRMQQAINASLRNDRKVAFYGRSVRQNMEVARKLGYLQIPSGAQIDVRDAVRMPARKVTFIVAGSYGQEGSAIWRVANKKDSLIKIQKPSTAIFSGDPGPPGARETIDRVVNGLSDQGVDVHFYDIQENLSVSGHGSKGDLQLAATLVKPKFFIPIGAEPRHMLGYKKIIVELGYNPECIFADLRQGQIVEFKQNLAKLSKSIELTNIYVDGSRVGDVGKQVLKDRKILSEEGIVMVIVKKGEGGQMFSSVEIVSRGFVYMAKADKLIADAKTLVVKEVSGKKLSSWNKVKGQIEDKLERFLYRITERRPMILVVLVE